MVSYASEKRGGGYDALRESCFIANLDSPGRTMMFTIAFLKPKVVNSFRRPILGCRNCTPIPKNNRNHRSLHLSRIVRPLRRVASVHCRSTAPTSGWLLHNEDQRYKSKEQERQEPEGLDEPEHCRFTLNHAKDLAVGPLRCRCHV